MPTAEEIIQHYNLVPHPEGGHYKRIYQSRVMIPKAVLGDNFSGDRPSLTGIYYLLKSEEVNQWHRLQSDEIWQFILGDPIEILEKPDLGAQNTFKTLLGKEITQGQQLAHCVKAQTIFKAQILRSPLSILMGFSLVSCWVSPGFDFDEFEIFKQDAIITE